MSQLDRIEEKINRLSNNRVYMISEWTDDREGEYILIGVFTNIENLGLTDQEKYDIEMTHPGVNCFIRRIREYCIVKNLNHGLIPCLIDEIKPVFGLYKIGTHWANHENKKLLFLRVTIDSKGHIVSDLTLDKINSLKLRSEVCKIFAFRELLGMSKSFESSIIVRLVGSFVHVISFYDPNMAPSQSGSVVPNTVLEKWFSETSLDREVQKLVKIDNLEELGEKLFHLRRELSTVVQRCDPESIMFVDEILSRIAVRLQHSF